MILRDNTSFHVPTTNSKSPQRPILDNNVGIVGDLKVLPLTCYYMLEIQMFDNPAFIGHLVISIVIYLNISKSLFYCFQNKVNALFKLKELLQNHNRPTYQTNQFYC